jgi:hypothetical protein
VIGNYFVVDSTGVVHSVLAKVGRIWNVSRVLS